MSEVGSWVRKLGRMLPRRARECWFEPSVADLLAERRERGLREDGLATMVRVLGLAIECRLRAWTSRAGEPAHEAREGWLDGTLQDLRTGVRSLTTRPGFTAITVAVLTLGIGANVVFFGLLNALVLRPLPYERPEELLFLTESALVDGRQIEASFTAAGFLDWRERNESLVALSGYADAELSLIGDGRSERVSGLWVSSDFFETLGRSAALGRSFEGDPDAFERGEVVLGHGFWSRRFAGREEVLGDELTIGERQYRIVGVMPADFDFLDGSAEIYLPAERDVPPPPIDLGEDYHSSREIGYFEAVGRLAPGVTVDQARQDLEAVQSGIAERYPEEQGDRGAIVRSWHEYAVGDARELLQALLLAVGALLLVGTANVASLVLARTVGRRGELALRAALGASKGRLVRQLLIESIVLATVGGVLGSCLAWLSLGSAGAILPAVVPNPERVALDLRVLGFGFALSLLAGLLAGSVPAIQVLRGDLRAVRGDGRSAADPAGASRARSALVVGEVALSLLLVILAGLSGKAFLGMIDDEPGFEPEGLLTVRFALDEDRYAEDADILDFHDRTLERIRALPGVDGAALSMALPFTGAAARVGMFLEGQPIDEQTQQQRAILQTISDDYFETMGIPLLRGRGLGRTERPTSRSWS